MITVRSSVSESEVRAIVSLLRSNRIECVLDEVRGEGEFRTHRVLVRPEERSRADQLLSASVPRRGIEL